MALVRNGKDGEEARILWNQGEKVRDWGPGEGKEVVSVTRGGGGGALHPG